MNAFVCITVLATLIAASEAGKSCFKPTGNITADYQSFLACYFPNSNGCVDLVRFLQFQKCHDAFKNHNSSAKHKVTIHRHCHYTPEEWNKTLNFQVGGNNISASSDEVNQELRQASASLPVTVDWVAAGAVSAVKDQGMCGNCYTFGAAGALEGQYKQKCGILLNVSSEQFTDCSTGYQAGYGTSTWCKNSVCTTTNYESWKYKANGGNQGCNGGDHFSCWAWNNMTSTASVTSECYPLTSNVSGNAGTCSTPTCAYNIKVANYVRLATTEAAMAVAIATVGPIACSIDANPIMNYDSGVYNGTVGGSTNHDILVVGYGIWTDGVTPYWKIKNSWGTDWGVDGYMYIGRGWNIINIASNCGYPILASC